MRDVYVRGKWNGATEVKMFIRYGSQKILPRVRRRAYLVDYRIAHRTSRQIAKNIERAGSELTFREIRKEASRFD
jgi:hypothetical protein